MDGGGGGGGYRIEAERWLTISEKLLTARDFQGAKSFAIRARESDPRLLEFADQIIAVADTLLAGDLRIINHNTGSNNHDYYAILQLPRLSQSMELVATQYRKLALLLNPTRIRLSFADHAFGLVSEAWLVFSNPSKKALYDHELQVSQFGQLGQLGHQQQQFGQVGVPSHQDFHHHQEQQHHHQQQQQLQQQTTFTSYTESIPSTRSAQPRMTEPIRPIAQHKAAPTPEPIRPASQPKSTAEPTRPFPVAQNKATESAQRETPPVAATEPSRPAVQQKSPEPSRPNIQTNNAESSSRVTPSSNTVTESEVSGFWTACPYCFILYEYPKGYEDCAIRCQKCKRAFHAAMIPSPPVMDGKDTYFCCWGYFPLGFSGNGKDGGGGFGSTWSPVSAMFATPLPGTEKLKQSGGSQVKRSERKIIYKDDVYIDLSDPSDDDESDSDDDWDNNRRKKVKSNKGKSTTPSKNVKRAQSDRGKKVIVQNGDGIGGGGGNVQGEVRKGEGSSGKKRGAKDLGKLDLNVMFSNEVEEAVPGVSEGNGAENGEEDNIEGISFFEGLDEFLSSLPILSVVGDDKVKAS
ncbi:uncharacterized protein LOC8266865 [Ricinus communis]|uniref:Dnajc14 protein, putative n=1 Tax=Ricinus communis TaxID=3988 RepID=B9S9I3_RICCO|nr:uncharacterized protein LOC8266865 [Ricinus communis]EEF39739.1 dnajc14 protein, putative [Ricinus communis]|eukprot:XP_025013764.1 uncharacterized protein LOC8266865 [Ricinus communis]